MSLKSLSVVAAAAMALFAGTAQADTVNGFANGGFETIGMTTPADAWLQANAGYSLSTDAHTGSFSAQLMSPIDRASVATQNSVEQGLMAPLVVGDNPTFSFWAKGQAPNGVLFALRYLDGTGNIKADSSNQFFQAQINTSGWSQITYSLGAVPVGSVAAFVELVQFGGAAGTGMVLIDDVYLAVFAEPIDPPPIGVIPEPETYALMLMGLAAVGVAARRRRSV